MLGKIIFLCFLLLEGVSLDPNVSYDFKKDFTNLFPPADFLYLKYPFSDLPNSEGIIKEKDKFFSKDKSFVDVNISAKSALVVDADTGQILYDKEANSRRQIGSLTKIMTALVFLEKGNLEREIEVPFEASLAAEEGADINLERGETFVGRDLLEALLIASANDAAMTLADGSAGNEENFVRFMNEKVNEFKLDNTYFGNVTGFDDPENYSSAFDLSKIFREALKKEFISKTTKKPEGKIISLNTNKTHYFKTTDKLLDSYLNIEAGKTGFTEEAGECLILLTKNNERHFIIVVLGSKNRFQDAKALISFVKDAYHIE